MEKRCGCCRVVKDVLEFSEDERQRLYGACAECVGVEAAMRELRRRRSKKEWYQANKAVIRDGLEEKHAGEEIEEQCGNCGAVVRRTGYAAYQRKQRLKRDGSVCSCSDECTWAMLKEKANR